MADCTCKNCKCDEPYSKEDAHKHILERFNAYKSVDDAIKGAWEKFFKSFSSSLN